VATLVTIIRRGPARRAWLERDASSAEDRLIASFAVG
jgi:hypothetical protein